MPTSLNYSQRASANERQRSALLYANLPLQVGRAGPEEMEPVQKLSTLGHADKQTLLLLPACRLHLPAGPVTPVPAEVCIRNDILTSVP